MNKNFIFVSSRCLRSKSAQKNNWRTEITQLNQVFYNGILNKEGYLDLLQNVFLPWARRTCGRFFLFQQDNDPKHTSLEKALKGKTAKNAAEKFAQLEQAWKSIPVSTLTNLVDSMHRRCQAVVQAHGYATKY